MDCLSPVIIESIFKFRKLALRCFVGNTSRNKAQAQDQSPKALLEQMKPIVWVVLAEIPGHGGAVTQPWMANPLFESVA
jgi:hypothetical protein